MFFIQNALPQMGMARVKELPRPWTLCPCPKRRSELSNEVYYIFLVGLELHTVKLESTKKHRFRKEIRTFKFDGSLIWNH